MEELVSIKKDVDTLVSMDHVSEDDFKKVLSEVLDNEDIKKHVPRSVKQFEQFHTFTKKSCEELGEMILEVLHYEGGAEGKEVFPM